MRSKTMIGLVAVVAGMLALASAAAPSAAQDGERVADARTLVVEIVGLRSDRGTVRGGLYSRSATWLHEGAADEDCHARIHAGRARCVFHVTGASRVAFAALHDEDDDGEVDRDLLGIPSEGYAFSNDAREPLGPPSFDAAAFAAPVHRVHARYGI